MYCTYVENIKPAHTVYAKLPSDCSGTTSFTIAAAACVTDQQYLSIVKHAFLPSPFSPAPPPAPPPFSPAPPFPLLCRNNMCSSIMPFVSTSC